MRKFGYVAHSMLAMSLALSTVSTPLVHAEEAEDTAIEATAEVDVNESNVEDSKTTTESSDVVDTPDVVDDKTTSDGSKEDSSTSESKPSKEESSKDEKSDKTEGKTKDNSDKESTEKDSKKEKDSEKDVKESKKTTKKDVSEKYDSQGYTEKDIKSLEKETADKITFNVDYALEGDIVPEFTLRVGDENGKLLGEITASKTNYKKSSGTYELVMKLSKPIKFGQKLLIEMQSDDDLVQNVSFETANNGDFVPFKYQKPSTQWTLKPTQYAEFTVQGGKYGDGKGKDKLELNRYALIPSSEKPMDISLQLKTIDKVGLKFVTRKGNAIKNLSYEIDGKTYKTDSKGMTVFSTKELDKSSHTLSLDNYYDVKSGSGEFSFSIAPKKFEMAVNTYVLEKDDGSLDLAVDDTSHTGYVKTNIHTNASTEISDNWMQATMIFEDSKGKKTEFDINKDNPEISGLVEGTYKITTKSEYADVTPRQTSITIKNNKATTVDVDMKPKYTLEVDKDGGEYNFSVVNVNGLEDKEFKGTSKTVFGVSPSEAFTIYDNKDDKVYTVPIEKDSKVTKLTLGVGVTYGGNVTAPHTAEIIVMLLVFLGIAVIIGLLSWYFIRRDRRDRLIKGGMVGVLLLGTLAGTLSPFITNFDGGGTKGSKVKPLKALAATNVGNGSKGSSTQGSPPRNGAISTETNVSVLQVGFIDARHGSDQDDLRLGKSSTKSDLADEYKYTLGKHTGAVYIAPNTKSASIFKNSATIAIANGKGIQTILGKQDALGLNSRSSYVDTGGSSSSVVDKRLLPMGSTSADSNNAFLAYMGTAVELLGSGNNNQLWSTGSSNHNISTTIRSTIKENAKSNPAKYTAVYDADTGEFKDAEIFEGYVKYLKNTVGTPEAKEYAESIAKTARERVLKNQSNDIVMFFNVMVGHSRIGGDKSKMVFISLHETSQWYIANMKDRYPNTYRGIDKNHEEKIISAGGSLPGTSSGDSLAHKAPTYTFSILRKTAKKAVKPKSTKVKISYNKQGVLNTTLNPFTGWAYYILNDEVKDVYCSIVPTGCDGKDMIAKPLLKYTVKYKMYEGKEQDDGTMKYTYNKVMAVKEGTFQSTDNGDEFAYLQKTFVSAGGRPNENVLLEFKFNDILKGSTKVSHTSKNSRLDLEYFDEKKPYVELKVEDTKVTNKSNITKTYKKSDILGKTYAKGDKLVAKRTYPTLRMDDSSWGLIQNEDIPYLVYLGYYLGATEKTKGLSAKHREAINNIKPLAPLKFNKTKVKTLNAEMKVVVPMKYTKTSITGEQPDLVFEVPEYKVGKYIDNIVDPENGGLSGQYATYTVPVEREPNADTETLTPSGLITFSFKDVNTDKWSWFNTQPKPWIPGVNYDNINYDDTVGAVPLAGDALFTKTNLDAGVPDPVMNTKLAQWKNNYPLYDNTTLPTMIETKVEDAKVTKNASGVKYFTISPYHDWLYEWTKKVLVSYDCEIDGRATTCSSWVTKRGRVPIHSEDYSPAEYGLTVHFYHHNPDKSLVSNEFDEDVKRIAKKGYRLQSGTLKDAEGEALKLNIVPEVAMIFDAVGGNSSPIYAIGDLKRELKPTVYNTARFVAKDDDAEHTLTIKPTVEGASVATDPKAKSLASNLLGSYSGAKNSSEVIHRGSTVSTNFEVDGNLELKSYVLDIGNTVAKSTWGNDYYKADVISNKFFSSYLDETGGGWQATFKAIGSLVIDEDIVTEVKRVIKVNEENPEAPIEHVLEVRGTKLISVDGNKNYADWEESEKRSERELYEALEEMHLTDGSNGIFSVFEEDGGVVGSAKYVSLSNMLRDVTGTKAKMKKGDEWYNEDTSLLVLREYKKTFSVPDYMYTDKVPLVVGGYEASMDKNDFYSKGTIGHTQLKYDIGPDLDDSIPYLFNSTYDDTLGNKNSADYIVPDVSITDTMQ